MGTNFDRYLFILSKWPVESKKIAMDFGYYLRQLIKNKSTHGDVFPGSSAENSEKLNSLFRIINNVYGNKSQCTKRIGASGLDLKNLEDFLKTDPFKPIDSSKSKIFFWK